MAEASSCHILLVSNSGQTESHLDQLRDSEDKSDIANKKKAGGIVAPPSVIINRNFQQVS